MCSENALFHILVGWVPKGPTKPVRDVVGPCGTHPTLATQTPSCRVINLVLPKVEQSNVCYVGLLTLSFYESVVDQNGRSAAIIAQVESIVLVRVIALITLQKNCMTFAMWASK